MRFQLSGGIDGQYRPKSYFWALEAGFDLGPDIKGSMRRHAYRRAVLEGDEASALAILSEEPQSSTERQRIGAIHPSLMGGEYLPNRNPEEVEVARITIASTTWDVTCVYATPTKEGTLLRVVDEYNGQTISGLDRIRTNRPLTLFEFLKFFYSGWDLLACLDYNYSDRGYPRDEVHGFILDASSDFYAQFEEATHQYVDWWLRKVSPGTNKS